MASSTEVVDDPKKRVRGFCFVCNNYTEGHIQTIQAIDCVYLVYGKETAPTTGTPHLQGYLYLKNPTTVSAVRRKLKGFDVRIAHGSPSQNRVYCTKQDSKPYEKGSMPSQGNRSDLTEYVESIKSGKTDLELATDHPTEYCKYFKVADRLRKEVAKESAMASLKEDHKECMEWQKAIIHLVLCQPDRQVLWVWDEVGNTGKTWLARHLVAYHQALYAGSGSKTNVTFAHKGEPIVVFDFPRSSLTIDYATFESLKDRIAFNEKYESGMVIHSQVAVVIFANRAPDLSCLSADRWLVINLDEFKKDKPWADRDWYHMIAGALPEPEEDMGLF